MFFNVIFKYRSQKEENHLISYATYENPHNEKYIHMYVHTTYLSLNNKN